MHLRLALCAALSLSASLPLAAAAVNIETTILGDGVDETPGDGICDTDSGTPLNQCTLRAAIQEANALPGADTVLMLTRPANYDLSLKGAAEDAAASGDLDITSDITIEGQGYASTFIDGRKLRDRIFDVQPGGTLTLKGVSLVNGKTAKTDPDPSGGCLRSAGISTLENVFLYRCRASLDGGCLGVTGGTTSVTGAVFSACKARGEGGGADVRAAGTATFSRIAAGGCRAASGGAIASRGALTLLNATLALNKAGLGSGAAVLGAGTATIHSSTFAFNGKTNLATDPGTTVFVSNTIVSDAKTDCVGPVSSAGGNLESKTSCGFTGVNDQQDTDPRLFALALDAGAVPTVGFPEESSAVDHGLDGATCETTDARGLPRVDILTIGVAVCDVGAFEFQPPP
jgi:CSLREA domain-containing protein